MKEYKSDEIRNIAIVSHARAGKTSLTEALLYDAGAIDKLGRVDNGTTVSDFDEEEIQRKTSIESSLCICEWKGCKINLIDTPGYSDFSGEQEAAIRVTDTLLIVVDASMGVEAGRSQGRAVPRPGAREGSAAAGGYWTPVRTARGWVSTGCGLLSTSCQH